MLLRDLRRRASDEPRGRITFALVPGSSSSVNSNRCTAKMRAGEQHAITVKVDAAYNAVYKVHLYQDAAALAASPGAYSHLQNDTFPTYVSEIKSGDVDISFYLPLKKGHNTLRFWTEQSGLLVYGISVLPASRRSDNVIHGSMLSFTRSEGQDSPQGWSVPQRTFMLRAKNGVTDALSVNESTLATIPAGRYRVGLCCAAPAGKFLAVICGSKTATVCVESDTNTSSGAAYIDTGIEVEDVASSGLSVKIGDGGRWANVGAIILHRIS